MNHPLPVACRPQPLSQLERDIMELVGVTVAPVTGGWVATVSHVEQDRVIFRSMTRDSALTAYLDGENAWFKELDARLEERERDRADVAAQIEPKGIECHGRRF